MLSHHLLFFSFTLSILSGCQEDVSLDSVLTQSKQSIQKVKDTQKGLAQKVEAFKKEKAKIDAEVAAKNAKYIEAFQADIKQARTVILEKDDYLLCKLETTQGPFKVLEQHDNSTIAWFVNETKVTRRHLECGTGRASHGVGLGQGGRSCEAMGGPHLKQGLYPYQVPKGAPDDADFVCRLSFPITVKEIFKDLINIDQDSLTHVRSAPVQWSQWPQLRHKKYPDGP